MSASTRIFTVIRPVSVCLKKWLGKILPRTGWELVTISSTDLKFFLLGFTSLILLLYFLDDTQCCVEVRRGCGEFPRLLAVGTSERPGKEKSSDYVGIRRRSSHSPTDKEREKWVALLAKNTTTEILNLDDRCLTRQCYFTYISLRKVALGFWYCPDSLAPSEEPGWKKLILRYV